MSFDLASELKRIAELQSDTDRAMAYEDLCCDAEALISEGRDDEAIPIFEALARLDKYDDLLGFVRVTAIENLEDLGVRKPPSLDESEERLLKRFARLPDQKKLLAVGKSLHREFGHRRPEANQRAIHYLRRAADIGTLSRKDRHLLAQLESSATGT